jgi:arabinogalactan oligomer / maltooligosaccharide transport system permease protein
VAATDPGAPGAIVPPRPGRGAQGGGDLRAAVAPVRVAGPGRGVRWARSTGWRHLVGLAAVAFALFPVAWIVSAAVNPTGSISGQVFLPAEPTLANFRVLLGGDVAFLAWFRNTMVIAGATAAGTVALCALGAFTFSRMRFRGRRLGLLTLLLVQMFPQLLAAVAIYLLLLNIGRVFPAIGLGSQAGLILVYLGGALGVNTWLMKGFFDTIPRELDESAIVDGASHVQVFALVILPLVRPILATIALLSFIFTVNEFLIASVVLGNDSANLTLSVGLFRFISENYGARWGPFAAGALLGAIPVVALFAFLQRYLVSGLTSGAVKG